MTREEQIIEILQQIEAQQHKVLSLLTNISKANLPAGKTPLDLLCQELEKGGESHDIQA